MGKLRQTLNSLPETLDETYDRILCQLDPLFKREVLQILQWLTCSLRPLSLEELAETVAFDVDSDDKFNVENRLAEPTDVLTMCSSLVINIGTNSDDDEQLNFEPYRDDDQETNKADNIPTTSTSRASVMVRLAHFSVKEYLVSHRIRTGSAAFFSIDEEASNARIGATGISCLLLYDEVLFASSKDFRTEFPLARYSAEFWDKHLSAISGTAHFTSLPLAIELFLSESKMRNWQALWDSDWDSGYGFKHKPDGDSDLMIKSRSDLKSLGTPLYYAVLTGLKSLVEALIEVQEVQDGLIGATSNSELECLGSDNGSATLHYMSKDTYVNATGGVLHTPLQAASWCGRMDIVEILMSNGADPNIYGGDSGGSALWAAAHKGHLDIMKHLLEKGADIHEGILSETSGGSKGSRIGIGNAENPPDETIDKFTEEDWSATNIRMNKLPWIDQIDTKLIRPSMDTHDWRALKQCRATALHEAASSGDAKAAKFLLDRDESGVIINLRNYPLGETALSSAVWRGHDAVVQILLERGALVDKNELFGRSALMAACIGGHESIARKLLDKGADPNFTRANPMIDALSNDDERMDWLHLEKAATVLLAGYPSSPLGAATVANHEPIVRLLIDHGANVDGGFPLPLVEAVRRGYKDIAKLLVEKGADVNAMQSFDHKIPHCLKLYPSLVAMLT